ncbi:MAG: D-alanyl-D-alanine carboxypeptidase family protein [Candidatus Daviesbacteria bacterium]|nr:D-alanyl-D-alanine carboxypeptidase family protein [Candidatus Daviesbacteria bacterium]
MSLKHLLFVGIIFLAVVILFTYQNPSSNNKVLVSPLVQIGKDVGLNQWFPQKVLGAEIGGPEINARSAFFIDTKSGQVLFEKYSHLKLPIASLVKIMTVLVALEHKNLDDKFLVSQAAAETEPDKMWLIKGETLTLRELLYGIFLISANDGAEVLAEDSTGSREEFIKLMNSKATQLGMKDSYFANPTGLDEDTNNSYSSAYDLAILARYAVHRHPFLVDFSSTEHIILPITDTHQDYDMYSGINLLTTYPGVVGFKTGFTPEAGLTLVTLARRGGHEVLGVILGSQSRRDEAREILDYSFKKLGV